MAFYNEKTKIFYNPIWMHTQVDIQIFSLFVPSEVTIDSFQKLELYFSNKYEIIFQKGIEKYGFKRIAECYYDYIDDQNSMDIKNMVFCFLNSDKFLYQTGLLKLRIKENELPEDIIGTDEAIDLISDIDLLDFLPLLNDYYF